MRIWLIPLILLPGLLLSVGLFAEEPKPQAEPVLTVPAVFDQPVPRSLADLREMQEHLSKLVPKLTECTVNLKVGAAQGSGVIVTADGYVLTAAHVSGRPGRSIAIITSDGNRYEGKTLGRNNTLDASIVQIISDREDWPHCPLAENSGKPGDWCLAMGHPGGLQEDRGVVLRLGRVIDRNEWQLQTDCELIGGDSGGPLFNVQGQVMGINSRIGESTDVNIHVPIEAYHTGWERMLASEEFRTHSGAYLGISGMPRENGPGLLITKVHPGDPAARGGLRDGDILMTFNGKKVTDIEQLIEMVGAEFPGRIVRLGIIRDGETKDLPVMLGMRTN